MAHYAESLGGCGAEHAADKLKLQLGDGIQGGIRQDRSIMSAALL